MLTRTVAVALTATLLLATGAEAAAKKSTKKVTVLKPGAAIPDAREVELFEAIESGDITARVIPKDPFSAKVFIENKTDEPLNIKFPKAVVAAPILAQFGGGMGMGGGMGGMGGGMGGMGMGGMGGGMGGMGGGQSMGGGMGGMGGGMGGMGGMGGGMGGMGGGMGGMGGGFFSVPPEATVGVKLNTVCLQHGKPDPAPHMRYKLVPVELVTKNSALTELMTMVGSGKLNQQAAQAAAWHMTDNLSWAELASKELIQIGGVRTSYFSGDELAGAQQLLGAAMQRAQQNKSDDEEEKSDEPKPATTPSRRTARVSSAK